MKSTEAVPGAKVLLTEEVQRAGTRPIPAGTEGEIEFRSRSMLGAAVRFPSHPNPVYIPLPYLRPKT